MSDLLPFKIYLVGGAVRDELLNLHVADKDYVVVGATPEDMVDHGFKQVGADFPVFLHPKTHEEYALARLERKKGEGYHGFQCDFSPNVSIEDDLLRRDLTINAIAKDDEGQFVDPYGGRDDLANKVLRHVSGAFIEDPLRVLRVARFFARLSPYGFTVHSSTMALMKDMVLQSELDHLTVERVWAEIVKALKNQNPRGFIECLRECGALKVLLPELDKLWGVPQKKEYHPEIDTGVHVMMVLDKVEELSSDSRTRFAALCHDLGKGETPEEEWPSHKMHESRGVPLVHQISDRFKIPNEYRDLAKLTSKYHLVCHTAWKLKPKTVSEILYKLDAFRRKERFYMFLDACHADACGRLGMEKKHYPQKDFWTKALEIAQDIDVQSLIQEGFQGEALKHQIQKKRTYLLKPIVKKYRDKFEIS